MAPTRGGGIGRPPRQPLERFAANRKSRRKSRSGSTVGLVQSPGNNLRVKSAGDRGTVSVAAAYTQAVSEAGRHPPLFVVGIGASAGGLEALVELLGALRATGMAFIVVQHLDPTHESLLSEILAKKTTMAVSLATAGEAVKPDHVYVIPPDALLTVHEGLIEVKRRTSAPERPFPVDLLFSSLAVAYGEGAIGVVLSGGDADGSLGLSEIKHAGGFTFAQQPESARFPMMPRHAIETGCVDLVLRPKEIAGELARLTRRFRVAEPSLESKSEGTRDIGTDEHAVLAHIFQRLRSAHGVDFTHYKRTTIRRRIERRMMLRRIESLDEYRESLDRDPSELAALYQDFLIRVTEFFRDPAAFDALRQDVLPTLCESRSPKEPIRIWVPGCATGEEVYSVAIAVLEYFGDGLPPLKIQIFGTDVSEVALETARAGVYGINALQEVSAERLKRFFIQQNGEYRIAKDIRDLCLFARQDVTRDPPFSRLDLISCRNLLIYLDEVAQRRVLRTFHYALRPHGMLFFGPAESIAQSPELFEQIDSRWRVFRRIPNTGGGAIAARGDVPALLALEPEGTAASLRGEADSLPREADRLLLARFAPACVLVNQALTILQFRGQTGPYLEPAGGPPSFDLRRVIRPELLVQILPAIGETSNTGVASRRDVRLDTREISIEVIPLAASGGGQSFLILFDDGSRLQAGRSLPAPGPAVTESDKDRRLAHVERELEGMREYIRAAIEAHEAVQEELRSAHEEMLSANEEFQSTNEELETSKEELQSANEELTTTIDELRSRNQDLARLNMELDAAQRTSQAARAYADTIIQSVREPLAVLDGTLRILRVNSAFAANVAIPREEIEGRFLHEVGDARWNIPDLHQRLRALLASGQPLEDWEVTWDHLPQGRQVMSLSARRIPGDVDRAEQLLLAIQDVTARADMTARLVASGEQKDQFIAMLGHELRHPLTPITHAVYLLRKSHQNPATIELLETIDTQTQTLLRFVNELLDLSRISHGLIEIRPERLDVAAVARDAVHALQPFIEERQHVVSLLLPAAPLYVRGDPGRLRQVVSNLVENAAKYTEPGGRITVSLEQRGDEAVLAVSDTGIGIDAENLERIFEPFTRSDQPLARPSRGLGIGLSVVRRIVELHRGRIRVTSAGSGAGSEFVVSLPIWAADMRADRGSENVVNTSAPSVALRARRVLIVDDHEEMRTSISRLARAWGHEVVVAADGASALSLAEAFQPECAIVDVSMPGMSGIELGRRLRRRFPPAQLCLIALTGYADAAIRDACLTAGFDAHLVKPGEIRELERLLGGDREDADASQH
jgi:two-component system, chemotaxis family, CheB/CheR fusion protein